MKSEHEVFSEVIDILERLNIPYMIGGSVAAMAYGMPRLTLDMDVIADMSLEQAKVFAGSLGQEYYVSLESIEEAIKTRRHFNIIQSEVGVKIDFYVLNVDEFSREEFKRRRKEAFDEERRAVFATPEDIILKKLEWFKMGESQKHIDDIKGILKVSRDKLDLSYIDKWALKVGVYDIWQKLKDVLQIRNPQEKR
jgi:hypothetical protein